MPVPHRCGCPLGVWGRVGALMVPWTLACPGSWRGSSLGLHHAPPPHAPTPGPPNLVCAGPSSATAWRTAAGAPHAARSGCQTLTRGRPGMTGSRRPLETAPAKAPLVAGTGRCGRRWAAWTRGHVDTCHEWTRRHVDTAFLDACLWDASELPPGRDPATIPHPLAVDTLAALAGLEARVVLVHMNHTNPLWRPGSQQAGAALAAGFNLGREGSVYAL